MLIGISGKIGSGKDTLANFICSMDSSFTRRSYADKLKYVTSYLTGTSLEDQYTQEGKNIFLPEWRMTLGEFQQKLGTEGMRNAIHEDGWILALFADYDKSKNWVIADVRFPNEADAIKNRGGLLIRLEGDPAKVRENSKRDLFHASETSLDDYSAWDFKFQNTGSIDILQSFSSTVLSVVKLRFAESS